MREKILAIYIRHRPRKVDDVDALLEEWAGEEDLLLARIHAKYCVESSVGSKAAEERTHIAHKFMKQGMYQLAVDCLRDDVLPSMGTGEKAICVAMRGSCYTFMGRILDAQACFDEACELLPTEATYWHGAGLACMRTNQLEEAQRRLQKASALGFKAAYRDLKECNLRVNKAKAAAARRSLAATRIQAAHRGTGVRKKLAAQRSAVAKIQAAQRRRMVRQRDFIAAAALARDATVKHEMLARLHDGRGAQCGYTPWMF